MLKQLICVCRGDIFSSIDVLCYREITREGKRVNTHSLVVKGVKIYNLKSKSGTYIRNHLLVVYEIIVCFNRYS